MKSRLVLFAAALVLLASSCTYKTCPTYAKEAPKKAVVRS